MASLEEGAFEAGMSLFAAMVAAEQPSSAASDQPGCLVQGPEEKRGLAGRLVIFQLAP